MLFEVVDCVGKFEVTGGGQLLQEDLSQVVVHLACYASHIKEARIFTNGTIAPGAELLKVLRCYSERGLMSVLIDDYGPELSLQAKEVAKILAANEISFEPRD